MITYSFDHHGKPVVIKKPVGGKWYVLFDGIIMDRDIPLERSARRIAKSLCKQYDLQRAEEEKPTTNPKT